MPVSPNVLLVVIDQLRWDMLSCLGGAAETVSLDWLAAQGTSFGRAYSATPSCVPARASLLTGSDPWHTGILGMGAGQPLLANLCGTLPEVLSQAGYHTQAVGSAAFHPHRSLQGFHHTVLDRVGPGLDDGSPTDYEIWFEANRPGAVGPFDHGIGPNSWQARPYHLPEWLHPTNWTATESINFLRRRDPGKPFFLCTGFNRPHAPYDPPQWYFDLYDGHALPPPAVGTWAAAHDVPADASDPQAWHGRRTDREVQRARAGYYGSVHHVDHQIGRLLAALKDLGLDDDTMIVVTADHGDMLGDHHLWRKTYAYEGSAHIPLIVRLPQRMRGQVKGQVDAPVCLQDVMPTILDVVGVPIPQTVDGASLLPLIRGERAPWRKYVHGEHSTCYSPSQEMQYLTDGEWKYIWFPRTNAEQLFNLRDDPYEQIDFAEDPGQADQLVSWRRELVSILGRRGPGLTDGDALVCQAGRPPLVSPHARDRVN